VGRRPIFYQCAVPAAEPRGVVLIAHGYAEHLGRYRDFVAHLTGRGFASRRSITGDTAVLVAHAGIAGRSAISWPTSARSPTARKVVPDARLLFGHSMGADRLPLSPAPPGDGSRGCALGAGLRVRTPPRALQVIARLLGRIAPASGCARTGRASPLARPRRRRRVRCGPARAPASECGFYCAVLARRRTARAEAAHLAVPLLILQGDADRNRRSRPPGEIHRGEVPARVVEFRYKQSSETSARERGRVLAPLDRWFDRWLAP